MKIGFRTGMVTSCRPWGSIVRMAVKHQAILSLLLLLFLVSESSLGQQNIQSQPDRQYLNGEYPLDLIRMPIAFGDLEGELIVGIGGNHSLIDTDYQEFCGKQLAKGLGTDGQGIKAIVGKFEAFPFHFENEPFELSPVATFDLRRIQESAGGPVVGIVGHEFFKTNKLKLGFDSSQSRYYVSRDQKSLNRREFPFELNKGNQPFVAGILLSNTSDAISSCIVTELNATFSIFPDEYDRLKKEGRILYERHSEGVTLFGGKTARRAVLDRVTIFGKEFINVPFLEELGPHRHIGLGMLRRFDFLIDPEGQAIRVNDAIIDQDRFQCDLSGIGVIQKGRQIVVHSVDHKTFPESKAVQTGDVLWKINDQDVVSLTQVIHVLSTYSSSPTKITLQREKKLLDIEMNLVTPEHIGLSR